ncbi:MAG: M28 family peptidase [Thermoanaerobaculia bacterium]|nr:M28 family peptidase [Thermoanaerobaculia bacterium]
MRPIRQPEPPRRRGGALLLLALLLALLAWRERPPAPRSGAAPATEFSAERADGFLGRLLGDGAPHPLGSPANAAVRARLLEELAALGLVGEVERSWVCGGGRVCGEVSNLLARLPAAGAGPAVLLVAHYDSVAAGPGAADDGSGVAVLLETARALLAGPPLARPVWLLFPDGEEVGLLGAEAFAARPHLAEVGVVLNFEARGQSGLARMFETGERNLDLVRLLAAHGRRPAATSLSYEIYRRLPNDTDFSVFKRAGLPGLNFAFIGEPLVYHTPLDDRPGLSPDSLQHQGEQALALARPLAADPAAPAAPGRAVFFDVAGFALLHWPESWSVPLALAALLLLLGRAAARRRAGGRGLLAGALAPLAALAAAGAAGWLLHRALAALGAFPARWTATLDLAAWGFVALGLAVAALFGRALQRRTGWEFWTGTWTLWALAGLALAVGLPGASYLAIAPALVAALAGLGGRAEEPSRAAWLLPLAAAGLLWLPTAFALPLAMGNAMLPAVAGIAAWVAGAALGPLGAGRARGRALLLGGVAVALALAALLLPAFTPERPLGLALRHIETADGALWTASARPPAELAAAGGFGPGRPLPWVVREGFVAPAPRLALPAPEIELRAVEEIAGGRRVTFALRSPRGAPQATLWLAGGVELRAGRVAGAPLHPERARPAGVAGRGIAIATLPAAGVEIELELGGAAPVSAWVADASYGLPAEGLPLQRARGETAVPVGAGDQTVVVREIEL